MKIHQCLPTPKTMEFYSFLNPKSFILIQSHVFQYRVQCLSTVISSVISPPPLHSCFLLKAQKCTSISYGIYLPLPWQQRDKELLFFI